MNMQTSEARRTRKEYGARASRTYYAINEKGDTLYRFKTHTNREDAIKSENLLPLGALEFRNKLAADVDGALRVVEQRVSGKLKVTEPRKRGPGRPRKVVEARRGPGRPPKVAAVATAQTAKRGPGRPRKVVTEPAQAPVAASAQHITLDATTAKEFGAAIVTALLSHPHLSAVFNAGKVATAQTAQAGVPTQGQ